MFVDQAKIYLKAGNGGKGCHSIFYDRYHNNGQPDGGAGGKGGGWKREREREERRGERIEERPGGERGERIEERG